jgi:hypothetical protein
MWKAMARERIDQVAELRNFKSLDEWYNANEDDTVQLRGLSSRYGSVSRWYSVAHILTRFRYSIFRLMRSVYRDFAWNPSKFVHLKEYSQRHDKYHWKDPSNLRRFFLKLEKSIGITDPEMWYRVSKPQIDEHGGAGAFRYFPKVLELLHPQRKWVWKYFCKVSKRTVQRYLLYSIAKLFPSSEVVEEHVIGVRDSSGKRITVDIFVPEHNLAFEYQGTHLFLPEQN